jgi:serine protease Do
MIVRLPAGAMLCVCAISSAFALSPEQVFERAAESIVTIATLDSKGALDSFGSGVVIAPREVVTNCHVIRGASAVGGRSGEATFRLEVRFYDEERDLCQLHALDSLGAAVPVREIVSAEMLRVGQKVYAVGNPRGLELSLSDGLVSSLRRAKDGSIGYIQTTAPISPGSSGGGLFDADGRLIGITALKLKDSENLNFALPADWVRELAGRRVDLLRKTIPDSRTSERERELARKERELERREAAVRAAEDDLKKGSSDASATSDAPGSALESFRKAAGIAGPDQSHTATATGEAVAIAPLPSAPKRKKTDDNDALSRFALDVARQLGKEMRADTEYPARARAEGAGGTVQVLLRISADGKLSDVKIASSSGNDDLDRYACDKVANLQMPMVPAEFRSRAFTVQIPVTFAVRKR